MDILTAAFVAQIVYVVFAVLNLIQMVAAEHIRARVIGFVSLLLNLVTFWLIGGLLDVVRRATG